MWILNNCSLQAEQGGAVSPRHPAPGARTALCAYVWRADRALTAGDGEHLSRPQTEVVIECAKWPSVSGKAIF